MQAEVAQGRVSGRLAVGGSGRGEGRLSLRFRAAGLPDGRTVAVARDVTEIERFLAVQAAVLAVVAFLVTAFSGLLAFFVGGRILKLNDLAEVVRTAYELYAPLAEDAGLSLMADVPKVPLTFSGHRGKIQRLLANLVENAVKYTPRGGRVAAPAGERAGARAREGDRDFLRRHGLVRVRGREGLDLLRLPAVGRVQVRMRSGHSVSVHFS